MNTVFKPDRFSIMVPLSSANASPLLNIASPFSALAMALILRTALTISSNCPRVISFALVSMAESGSSRSQSANSAQSYCSFISSAYSASDAPTLPVVSCFLPAMPIRMNSIDASAKCFSLVHASGFALTMRRRKVLFFSTCLLVSIDSWTMAW